VFASHALLARVLGACARFLLHAPRPRPQVLIRRAAVSELLALHRKVNDKETIVGW
jgi:hypothetical protein